MSIRTFLAASSIAALTIAQSAVADAATFKVIYLAKFNQNSELFLNGSQLEQPVIGPGGVIFGGTRDGGSNTFNGGTKEFGVLYSLTPPPVENKKWKFKTIYTFRYNRNIAMGATGGPLTSDNEGGFFGTTQYGANGFLEDGGAIFHLAANGATFKQNTLYQFDGTGHGALPLAGVIRDSSGNLFGTTSKNGPAGGGTIFELSPGNAPGSAWTLKTLHSFAAVNGQGQPKGELLRDAGGNLFGVTQSDGPANAGTVYQLSPQTDGSWSYTVLYAFAGGADGGTPSGGLLFDPAGNLYGTVSKGGANGQGAVFKLSPRADGAWTQSVLYSFAGGGNGAEPSGGVVMDDAGNLFGTTKSGGFPNGAGFTFGTVYELSPVSGGSWDFKLIHALAADVSEGGHPESRLVRDQAGHIFGTAPDGGLGSGGLVFEVTP